VAIQTLHEFWFPAFNVIYFLREELRDFLSPCIFTNKRHTVLALRRLGVRSRPVSPKWTRLPVVWLFLLKQEGKLWHHELVGSDYIPLQDSKVTWKYPDG
jgi:hypothetical protein